MESYLPSVDVIVVFWNHRRFVEPLMEGFLRVRYPREALTVHIVDNASTDGSMDAVKAFIAERGSELPKIVLHEPGKNLGFAGGNNLVLRSSIASYAYLINPDAGFEEDTLAEAVAVAEARPNAASVQSLLVLAQDSGVINSVGNDIHFAGFGYCRGYLRHASEAPKEVTEIAYASGAGMLCRISALRKVGVFDETLFAYHEDLDLGWRFSIAGYENVLAPKSVLRHHFEFSRSISKWYLMERNRGIVLLSFYRIPTLILLFPAVLAIELATWMFSLIGGWAKDKARACAWFLKPSSWIYLRNKRRAIARLRVCRDRDVLRRFVSGIEHQETETPFMSKIANPLMALYFAVAKALIVW